MFKVTVSEFKERDEVESDLEESFVYSNAIVSLSHGVRKRLDGPGQLEQGLLSAISTAIDNALFPIRQSRRQQLAREVDQRIQEVVQRICPRKKLR